ncbi:bifunctional non-homologous end joining protein LigD [Prosthecobacter fusiformis]|uniref:Bifunctional non-homologous end joining protein LigD n=1 Tax=Prosthecobacter fusiformis TaxID=48464 RepID=A0A4R7SS46_9BACT|nr:non-homologous end-joining DNA ligase [Prosthecobacter fusiformis]TDU81306.1 bifunctional non-homologous end joining protein LigD [Prosthecobacter fusiformis]
MSKKSQLEVEGVQVPVSNLEKVMYPKTGFTKGDVINYYIRVAEYMLPHLASRAITLKRYPDGVDGFFFYEKQCPDHAPEWIKTTKVAKTDGSIDYCVIGDLPSLVWVANLANLEFHTFLHRKTAVKRPAVLAFDLDPGPPADILTCCKVGLLLKDLFDSLGLQSFPKTSGSKGLQVYVPLNTPVTYDRTKAFAQAIAQALEQQCPDLVVSKMLKKLRDGKVLLDWSQNDDHKTTVNVYSLRAKERPTISTPVTWEEVENALKRKKPLVFETKDIFKRLKKHGDLFAPVLTLKQKLPAIRSLE